MASAVNTENSFRCAVRIRPLIARDADQPICLELEASPLDGDEENVRRRYNVHVEDRNGSMADGTQGREFHNLHPVIGPETGQPECYGAMGCSDFCKAVLQG